MGEEEGGTRSRSKSNGAGEGRRISRGQQRDRMELMPCLRHKALNAQMREKISPGGAGGGEIDRSRSGSRSRNRCRSRSSTYASRSRSRSRSRERNGNEGGDDDDDDNTRKTAPPKSRRSRNDLNQQDCDHHDNNDKSVINIPIHTPNDGLKSALKKRESKEVVNLPIHTSGQSRNRSEEHCLPINIPIHTWEKYPNNGEHCPINIPIHNTTTIGPQKERSTIRPWRKSNKEESTWKSNKEESTVKTWSDYSSNNNTLAKQTGEDLISLPIKMPDCHNCATKKTNHPHEGPDPACVTSNLESITEEVKNKLRDLGKHGRFQIEFVKDTSQDFKSTIQKSGRWERTVSKTSTFQLFP